MTSHRYENDDRFRDPGYAMPLTFLCMFVVFIYGALLMGLLDVSDWFIHSWHLTFFTEKGIFGVYLMVFSILAAWFIIVALCASIPYFILRACGRYIQASKVATVIIFAMFHIFAFPWILWPMVRRGATKLRRRRMLELRQMTKGKKMQERLAQRHAILVKKGYHFSKS